MNCIAGHVSSSTARLNRVQDHSSRVSMECGGCSSLLSQHPPGSAHELSLDVGHRLGHLLACYATQPRVTTATRNCTLSVRYKGLWDNFVSRRYHCMPPVFWGTTRIMAFQNTRLLGLDVPSHPKYDPKSEVRSEIRS